MTHVFDSSAMNCSVHLLVSKFGRAKSLQRSVQLLVCARSQSSVMLKYMGNSKHLRWCGLFCCAAHWVLLVLLNAKQVQLVYWWSCRAVQSVKLYIEYRQWVPAVCVNTGSNMCSSLENCSHSLLWVRILSLHIVHTSAQHGILSLQMVKWGLCTEMSDVNCVWKWQSCTYKLKH